MSGADEKELEDETRSAVAGGLCRSCGLCCDGTLYSRVPLARADAHVHLSQAGAVVEERGDKRALLLPCGAFCAGDCRVYESRPQACREFVCRMLAELRDGRITTSEARDIVGRARALVARLSERMLRETEMTASVPPAVFVKQLRSSHIAPGATVEAFERTYARVLEELHTAQMFLAKHFAAEPGSDGT